MININRITPEQMAWIHELRSTRQLGWESLAKMFLTKYNKKIGKQPLSRSYYYAMNHGFSGWTEYPEGKL